MLHPKVQGVAELTSIGTTPTTSTTYAARAPRIAAEMRIAAAEALGGVVDAPCRGEQSFPPLSIRSLAPVVAKDVEDAWMNAKS